LHGWRESSIERHLDENAVSLRLSVTSALPLPPLFFFFFSDFFFSFPSRGFSFLPALKTRARDDHDQAKHKRRQTWSIALDWIPSFPFFFSTVSFLPPGPRLRDTTTRNHSHAVSTRKLCARFFLSPPFLSPPSPSPIPFSSFFRLRRGIQSADAEKSLTRTSAVHSPLFFFFSFLFPPHPPLAPHRRCIIWTKETNKSLPIPPHFSSLFFFFLKLFFPPPPPLPPFAAFSGRRCAVSSACPKAVSPLFFFQFLLFFFAMAQEGREIVTAAAKHD